MRVKRIHERVFLAVALVLFAAGILVAPDRYGDGNEYFLTLESLYGHLTPDLRGEDIMRYYTFERLPSTNSTVLVDAFGEPIPPTSGYVKNVQGNWYAIHFWGYSLTAAPAKVLLALSGLDSRKSLQLTNAVLFIAALYVVAFRSKFNGQQKVVFMTLLTVSPIFWFVHWTHAEIFVVSFVAMGLVFMDAGRYRLAVLCASLASLQNQAVAVFTAFVIAECIWKSKDKLAGLAGIIPAALPSLIPTAFYLATFGKPSILASSTSTSNVSAGRVFELLFDLNIGMLPYIPITLLLSLGLAAWSVYAGRRVTLELKLLIVALLIGLVCSSTANWNHGTTGPSRYTLLMMPILFYIIAKNARTVLGNGRLRALLAAGLLFQMWVIFSLGGFQPRDVCTDHSYIAKLILDNAPGIYNPDPEVFCERTIHKETACYDPTIYGEARMMCKKAYVTCRGMASLQKQCGPPKGSPGCPRDGWFYVDY